MHAQQDFGDDAVAQWQRPLLPAGLVGEGGPARTPRDWVVDTLMFALTLALAGAILASPAGEHSPAGWAIDLGAGAVSVAALGVRRRHPWGVAVGVLALSSVSALASAAAVPAVFNASIRLDRRQLGSIVALAFVTQGVHSGLYRDGHTYDWTGPVIGALLAVIAISCGLLVRAQRDLVSSLHDRAQRLRLERELYEKQARMAERRRIAREMHDVLAHRISLLGLHAGALEFRPDASTEQIQRAAAVVRSAAQGALQELGQVIWTLREDSPHGPTRPLERPRPTLAHVQDLVEESTAAGARVALSLDIPDSTVVPPALGRTAYRIVQEGLTNARKHAPTAAIDVNITRQNAALLVAVVNGPPTHPPATGARTPRGLPGAGAGLIGLSERVHIAGGTLTHGPDAAGNFALRATLPCP